MIEVKACYYVHYLIPTIVQDVCLRYDGLQVLDALGGGGVAEPDSQAEVRVQLAQHEAPVACAGENFTVWKV